MTANAINVKALARTQGKNIEQLGFEPGVNVIVGEPNVGKTTWLRLLDYLWGDVDSAAKSLGDMAEKYDGGLLDVTIGGTPMRIERHWKKAGAKGKVYVDETPIDAGEFSALFLERLNVPVVRIPKGNPYSSNTWPQLSWRSLLRHIYRHEKSWGDLAAKQPEADQHAVFLQFIGAAEAVFSSAYAKLVTSQKHEARLEAQRENFNSTLADLAGELVQVREIGQGFTNDAVAAAIEAIESEIRKQATEQEKALMDIREASERHASSGNNQNLEKIKAVGVELDMARVVRAEVTAATNAAEQRLVELSHHLLAVKDELKKLDRARSAGSVLGPLRVTHCPVCDRETNERTSPPDTCYLCCRPHEQNGASSSASEKRLSFEQQQLKEEEAELQELIGSVQQEVELSRRKLRDVVDDVSRLEALTRPVQAAAGWLLPYNFGIADYEKGRLHERLRQLQRVDAALARRTTLERELSTLREAIARLEEQVALKEAVPEFSELSNVVADAMMNYLGDLDEADRSRWGNRVVSMSVSKAFFRILVDGRPWSTKVGANLTAYLFLSYHYAMLKVSPLDPFLYPGFVALDFPANLSDFGISDQENYLLRPFVKLLGLPQYRHLQLIAAGRGFAGLSGANRIDLCQKWHLSLKRQFWRSEWAN